MQGERGTPFEPPTLGYEFNGKLIDDDLFTNNFTGLTRR